MPQGAAFVRDDRDQPDGLSGVARTSWDAVVDVTGHPVHVRRAVRELQTDHWVFVTTANVYPSGAGADVHESAPLLAPFDGDRTDSMDTYGSAKVACEVAYRDTGTPATLSSTCATWRCGWCVLAAEEQLEGAFNVTGPTLRLSQVLDAAARAAGSTVRRRALSATRLAELGISAWMGPASLQLCIDDPSTRGFGTLDVSRVLAAGLMCHPWRTLSAPRSPTRRRVRPRAQRGSLRRTRGERWGWRRSRSPTTRAVREPAARARHTSP
ncbi:MAG: hypothetical protein Q4P07_07075 [Ornithinimicrobium sp.]|uniref:hypothetical protein n=1 Tax=Ornithinimicrobium sp. TaxID=1977084 RepID=UPI0026E0E390|nr:hypothetical protein [Ornithinimicrobium sp.]MDO5739896.1 hypothetical protein [Ornithinimicrobium sp.]